MARLRRKPPEDPGQNLLFVLTGTEPTSDQPAAPHESPAVLDAEIIASGETPAETEKLLALVPSDYLTSPFFAARPQSAGREVACRGRLYQIGGFAAFEKGKAMPALDVRHGTLLLVLMSFWNSLERAPTIKVSFVQLCERLGWERGTSAFTKVRALLDDLWGTAVRVRYKTASGVQTKIYRIVESIDEETVRVSEERSERQLRAITLTQRFVEILRDVTETMHARVDVLTRFSSPIAKAIYLYIPSRAIHRAAGKPFEIRLATLFKDIAIGSEADFAPGGKYTYRSSRLKLLVQHADKPSGSIMNQLDKAELLTGRLRVRIATDAKGEPRLSEDGDHLLQAWVERDSRVNPLPSYNGEYKLLAAWQAAGGSDEEFRQRYPRPLNDYEEGKLEAAGVNVEGSRKFLERAKSLIPDFEVIVGQLADDVATTSHRPENPVRNPTAVIIHRLLARLGGKSSTVQPALASATT